VGYCRGAAGRSLNWLPCTTFVSTAAWLSPLMPRSLQVPALAMASMTRAICSSGAHVRDHSTAEEQDEEQILTHHRNSFCGEFLIRRSRPQSVQAVVSAKSTDNQSMGEEEGWKMLPVI